MEKVGEDVPKTDESDVGISSINKEVGMKKSVLTIRALVIPALLILGGCTGVSMRKHSTLYKPK